MKRWYATKWDAGKWSPFLSNANAIFPKWKPRLFPFQAKTMQVLLLMQMQNANKHVIMQIFLYFQNKWMKMQNGITKLLAPAKSTKAQG